MRIAVVTATLNRSDLLRRLKESLDAQHDQDFIWGVYVDGTEDETGHQLSEWQSESNYAIDIQSSQRRGGKCRALNSVFKSISADLYVVVDDDDALHPTAISEIRRTASTYENDTGIGALFFEYVNADGQSLRSLRASQPVKATRVENDSVEGKYDGCVAYYRRVTSTFSYPEVPGETYIGPTVLQMLMSDEFSMIFVPIVVGVAEYQPKGLTASGRHLRLSNPRGMRIYSALQLSQSSSIRDRAQAAVKFAAYDELVRSPHEMLEMEAELTEAARSAVSLAARAAGWAVARRWKRRYRSNA